MNEQIHLTRNERSVYFWKLMLMYAVGVALLGTVLFWGGRGKVAAGPEWKQRFAERTAFTGAQIEALRIIDSMVTTMEMLKGDARQTFIQADLQDMVKNLSALYGNGERYDGRALAFVQASRFMQLRLEDILTLNTEKQNAERFEQQLANCKAGYTNTSPGNMLPATAR